MMPGGPLERDLARVYAVCEDVDADLGPLAAELSGGQLRPLVTDVLGKLSAIQWYCARRLGGIPGRDGDGAPPQAETGQPDGIDMATLHAMANHSATVPEDGPLAG